MEKSGPHDGACIEHCSPPTWNLDIQGLSYKRSLQQALEEALERRLSRLGLLNSSAASS